MAETTAKKPGRKPKTQTAKAAGEVKEIETAKTAVKEEKLNPIPQSAEADSSPSQEEPKREPTFTEEQVQAMIAAAVAKATAEAVKAQAPQIVQVTADTEKVHFLWQAEVSDENVFEVGPNGMYGRIIGKTGSFFVPKSDLSRVMDAMFRLLLQKRWIIAVDGLTDDEREAYGVAYKEGEILDKKGFARMVELGAGMLEIYPKLCPGHREMVAKRYHEAYLNRSNYVTRDIVVELNRMSKQYGSKDGDFTDIIEAMNASDLK